MIKFSALTGALGVAGVITLIISCANGTESGSRTIKIGSAEEQYFDIQPAKTAGFAAFFQPNRGEKPYAGQFQNGVFAEFQNKKHDKKTGCFMGEPGSPMDVRNGAERPPAFEHPGTVKHLRDGSGAEPDRIKIHDGPDPEYKPRPI
ncbi:hypothetical protein KM903_21530 [Bacillus glycinifermentans]|uniref:hypothetical protein n=1 Tax=Bacillus glycinifermentans TaxID=1664069 RepID=UPI001C240BD3|nr:hypothetical protein [Bacillus glycinifermentans]MBU8788919.1 hypothetical protein [Bacillus glycinifermentans]